MKKSNKKVIKKYKKGSCQAGSFRVETKPCFAGFAMGVFLRDDCSDTLRVADRYLFRSSRSDIDAVI